MIARIAAAATAIAMLAHSVLGCCWHHVHHDGSSCASYCTMHEHREHVDAALVDADGGDADAHHHDQPGRGHHDPADEPDCSFVGGSAPFVADFGFGCLATLTVEPATCSAAAACLEFSRTADSQPLSTARMRAQFQVWVI